MTRVKKLEKERPILSKERLTVSDLCPEIALINKMKIE